MDGEARFNETIHAPLRLRICSLLRPVNEIDFSVLREALGVNDVNLSKHLKVLAEVGFVKITKSPSPARSDHRRVTWVKLTPAGRKAFDAHVAELRIITAGGSPASRPQPAASPRPGPAD